MKSCTCTLTRCDDSSAFFPLFSTSTRISSLHKQTKLAAPEVLTLLHQVRSSVVKVFVSHRWLSGWWPGAPHEGSTWYREECERAATSAKQLKHEIAQLPGGSDWWRGHPDQQGHPKAQLVLEAISRMQHAGWIPKNDGEVVLWLDFACANQAGLHNSRVRCLETNHYKV